jgi:hypothetical protein
MPRDSLRPVGLLNFGAKKPRATAACSYLTRFRCGTACGIGCNFLSLAATRLIRRVISYFLSRLGKNKIAARPTRGATLCTGLTSWPTQKCPMPARPESSPKEFNEIQWLAHFYPIFSFCSFFSRYSCQSVQLETPSMLGHIFSLRKRCPTLQASK